MPSVFSHPSNLKQQIHGPTVLEEYVFSTLWGRTSRISSLGFFKRRLKFFSIVSQDDILINRSYFEYQKLTIT